MYTVLPKSLLLAFITKDDFSVHEVPVAAATMEAEILSYTDQLRQASPDSTQTVQETSKRLYQTLLGTVTAQLQPGKRLCIIPDKSLHYLSFASLISPVTEKYLIQDWSVLYAPSMNVLWRSSKIGSVEQTHLNDLSLLVIGNPRFNREGYPNLAPLESAEREVKSIAALFTTKTVLLGPQATKQNVMRAMDSAQVIHFAGHYIVDDSTPLLSKMLLATHDVNDPIETDSVLYAHEIIRHGLGQARLIVLAACDTAIEKYYRGEGAAGLARSFLEAKVPLVVATQWSVDSEATTSLMTKFYQHRHRGLPTTEAMQQAQIEMLKGSDPRYQMPYYWSGFLCVGGNVHY
jgi:CHAT domain-containing protein